MNTNNGNGYVIYPQSIRVGDYNKALAKAAELSLEGEDTRVEDCDTERVVARFREGKQT